MPTMVRVAVLFLMAFAVAPSAYTQTNNRAPDAARSPVTAAETGPCAPLEYEPPDLTSLSRLRALRQMDCIASLMDQKLASGGSVTMSREELERIRSLAISARVSAQLIGR